MTEHRIGTQEEWQRPLPAARLPLHVRAWLRGRLPGLLLDRGHARPQVPHLKARDTTLLLASRAPLAKLIAYRERMGWGIDWVSSGGSDFNRDLGFLYTEEELKPFLEGEIPPTVEQNARMCGTDVVGYVSEGPGLSAYALAGGIVYRTYVTTARGLEPAMAYYALLDRTPEGRDESDTRPHSIRRHDEYETSQPSRRPLRRRAQRMSHATRGQAVATSGNRWQMPGPENG
jgi:hypothetical protein